jgi:rhodanese-related sulfurtransferase
MATLVDRDGVRELLEQAAQLVEVLPAKDHDAEHIPGAISIPLKILSRETARQLDPGRPVIVYCYDYQ